MRLTGNVDMTAVERSIPNTPDEPGKLVISNNQKYFPVIIVKLIIITTIRPPDDP